MSIFEEYGAFNLPICITCFSYLLLPILIFVVTLVLTAVVDDFVTGDIVVYK